MKEKAIGFNRHLFKVANGTIEKRSHHQREKHDRAELLICSIHFES
jgi:hypothetical protein